MSRESVWIVIPTLDERQNLSLLLPHLMKVDPLWRVVVVDDGSIDGTRQLLLKLSMEQERVHAIFREKTGLGSALRDGMGYALRHGATRVVTMDADLSHDPEAIPRLLGTEADIVLGSRYVKGGDVVGWPSSRKAISFVANRLSRFSLGTKERDLTTGFRAYSRRMVELILEESVAEGYNFQVEAVHLAKKHRMSIAEVPIVFRERLWGDSKLSSPREASYLLRMLAMRSPLRLFLLVGLIGSLINELLLVSLVGLMHLHYLTAGIVAVEAGILSSFLLNEKWTFRTRSAQGWPLRLARYNGAVFGGILLNLLVLFILTEYANLLYLLSNIFAMGTALSWNYFLMSLFMKRF
jgi:dolichol-phosphate mannosyltransferase